MWRYFLFFLFFSNEVISQDYDPPYIKSFTFTPDTIDVTNSAKTITVRVEALDSTGVKDPGDPVFVQIRSNQAATTQKGYLKLVSGTVKNGIWEATITIPKGAQPGNNWSVFTNPWSDSLNNSGNFVNINSNKFLVVNLLQTSGILNQNLVINKVNSPYKLTGDLQIPENLSLTINEGGEFDGNNFSIGTKGDFIVNGTKQNPVKINNITLNAIGTNGDLGYSIIDINYSIIRRSKILTPTGNSDKPKIFKLKNSYINTENLFSGNNSTIYGWYFPIEISGNIFENAPTIFGLNRKEQQINIVNNNFKSWPTNSFYKGLITWYTSDSSKVNIRFNCFGDTSKNAATYYYPESNQFNINSNYWGSINKNVIDKMIYDGKDDIAFKSLNYEPYLNTCPIETPKLIIPKVKKRQYDIQLLSKPPQKDFLIGGIESFNIDSSLFNFFSVKLKNKADSQFVYLNNNNLLIKDSTRFNKVNNPLKIYLELDNGNSINTDSITINTICPILNKPILQPISQSNIFSYCEGDTLKLNVSSGTFNKGDTLKWYLDNKLVGNYNPSGILTSFNFTDSGKLFVIKSDSIGCKISSDTVSLIKNLKPSPPQLIRDSTNNLVSNYETNIWALNGIPLSQFNWPGINVKFIKPTASGEYTVSTVQKGCFSLKSSYYFLVTDILNLSANEFIKLVPNPVKNHMNIDFVIKGYQRLNIDFYELSTGLLKYSNKGVFAGSQLYLGQLSPGTYVVSVRSEDGKVAHKLKIVKL
jgi:serine protease